VHISELKAKNFRLLKDIDIELNSGMNIFFGPNAQGKTTLLEAIRLISTGRSFITNTLKEIITFENDHFFLKANILQNYLPVEIKFGFGESKKIIQVNSKPLKNLSDLIGIVDSVLFVPDDFNLVTGSPEIKRRYIDIQLSQAKNEYLENLKAYNKVLKNRNALLKNRNYNKNEMQTWTEELLKYGTLIIMERKKSVSNLNKFANEYLSIISGNKENLKIDYKTIGDIETDANIKNQFRILMEKTHQSEQKLGFTLIGPHKDNLEFYINNINAKKFASRGQLKSISIALKFAEADNLKLLKGYYPLFLFDDIFSELDETRKDNILSFIKEEQQTIIVSTNHNRFVSQSNKKDCCIFEMSNGKISLNSR